MGSNISSETNQQNSNTFKIDIDLTKEISPDLKQLINWSLQQVRDIYSAFRRRKSSPILNRTQFARLVNLSRTSSFYLYPLVSQKGPLTVFVVIAMMVLTSYSNLHSKLHFLFIVFDLCGKSSLKLSEMRLFYRSIVMGYCLFTKQPCPKIEYLEKHFRILYTKSDMNDNQVFQIEEIVQLIQNNSHSIQLFMRFESPVKIKEEFHIFNKFSNYRQKQAHFVNKLVLDVYQDTAEVDTFMEGNWSKVRNRSLLVLSNEFQEKLSKSDKQNTHTHTHNSRSNLANKVIIIKGKSITRKEIFKLKDYFDNLSSGYPFISLPQFIEAFSGDKFDHMRSITASLFNFLDRKQSGKVSFSDLLFKIYPSLSLKQFDIIKMWISQYQKMFNSQKKLANQKKQDVKKKLLPKNCITRVRQIFNLFDKQKKGWVSLENLQQMFKQSFTEKQVVDLFARKDVDKDGKLSLQQFLRILLPNDVGIQGMNSCILPPINSRISVKQTCS